MSAMAEQMAATLAVQREQIPEAVVSCTHAYCDDGGTTRTQTFDAIESQMTARQVLSAFGSLANRVFSLTVDITGERARGNLTVLPKAGDRITKRRGDDPATNHIIIDDPAQLDAVLMLTVGPENG